MAALLLSTTVVSCGRFQSYSPAPVAEPSLNGFVQRRLDDPALAQFLTAQNAGATATGWSPQQLALAALYFHPALREQAAAVDVARAAEVTAGTPPPLTLSAEVSRAARVDEGKSTPWSVSLLAGLTFEMGGKRAARRARARAFTLASMLRLQAAGWQLGAVDAARAAVRALGADRALADADSEHTALAELATLVRARYGEGQVTLADVAQAETEAQRALVTAAEARRARTTARLALARALAVPLRAVDTLPLRADTGRACTAAAPASFDSLGTLALRQRYDLGEALADYAVAEGDLRVEIARQYPDLTIGPGIAWDQGVARWMLSLATPGILRKVNRGPIAESRARRVAEARRVATIQDSVLVAVDSAAAVCRDASREAEATAALVEASTRSLALAQGAYARGETGATEVAFARVAVLRAVRAQHAAAERALEAATALESVLGAWPSGGPRWPGPTELTDLTTAVTTADTADTADTAGTHGGRDRPEEMK
jgi:outer membrane protein TolC